MKKPTSKKNFLIWTSVTIFLSLTAIFAAIGYFLLINSAPTCPACLFGGFCPITGCDGIRENYIKENMIFYVFVAPIILSTVSALIIYFVRKRSAKIRS